MDSPSRPTVPCPLPELSMARGTTALYSPIALLSMDFRPKIVLICEHCELVLKTDLFQNTAAIYTEM